jgi:hypothetical protein
MRNKKSGTGALVAICSAVLLTLTACGGGGTTDEPDAKTTVKPLAADEWVSNVGDFKDAANWDTAEVLTLDLGADAMEPAALELTAGLPYEIQISNSGDTVLGVSAPELFRASAVRKTESGAEIKLYQFLDVYANAGKTVSLFLVPVIPGTYPLTGVMDGEPVAGLSGTLKVTGSVPTDPEPVIENVDSLGVPAGAGDLIAAAIPTWDADATAVTITMGDNGDVGFYKPDDTQLKVGVPATITFTNEGTILHVYECEDFLKTTAMWKVTGSDGYDTGAQVRPADVEADVSTSLYVIPMVAGVYELTDSAPGMEEISITITVTE